MRVLSLSTIFPGSRAGQQGVFIKERQAHLPSDIDVTVARLRPKFPLAGLFKPHLRDDWPPFEMVSGLPVHDIRFSYVPKFFKHRDGDRLGHVLDRWLDTQEEGFDLLDAHFAFPTGKGAVDVARKRGLPSVITLRGTLGSYLGDRRRGAIAQALTGATRVISVSASLAEVARRVAGDDLRVAVVPNGIDTELFRPGDREVARHDAGLPTDRTILLTVGGLVPRKGVQRVLEVLPAIREKHPDVLYVVVGGGGVEGDFRREIEELVRDGDLGDAVRMVGSVPHDALPDYYRAADLFLLATSNEGWANVLQESLACGCPVVTTDVGGNKEVVGREEHGLVVPFGDPERLREAIDRGLTERWQREIISAWGRRRDWSDVGREVRDVYLEALGER